MKALYLKDKLWLSEDDSESGSVTAEVTDTDEVGLAIRAEGKDPLFVYLDCDDAYELGLMLNKARGEAMKDDDG